MPVGLPAKTTYANGDVFSASDINDTNGTINLIGQTNNFYAGKNKIINGNFGIWQRGTSFTTTSNTYTADRFSTSRDGTGTVTTSQQAFTSGTAPVSGYEGQYFLQMATTALGTSTYIQLQNRIEDVRTFAGQTVTVSFWMKLSSGTTTGGLVRLRQNFGSGGSATVDGAWTSYTPTSSWTRVTATMSVASVSGKTIGTSSFLELDTVVGMTATNTMQFWGVQVEAGSIATPFETATGTIQGELAAAQRYYVRYSSDASNPLQSYGFGVARATTFALQTLSLPVEMRIAPVAIEYGGNLELWDGVNAATAITTLGLDAVSSKYIRYTGNTASGLTQYRPYTLRAANTASAYVGFTSEL
jgi:hypothetical protein